MSLKQAAVSGVKWSSISQFGQQGMQFITTAILARLLSPSDFGLVGIAMVVTGFLTLFKDLGTSAAIIQRKNLSEPLLSSIFWVNLVSPWDPKNTALWLLSIPCIFQPFCAKYTHTSDPTRPDEPVTIIVFILLFPNFFLTFFKSPDRGLLLFSI